MGSEYSDLLLNHLPSYMYYASIYLTGMITHQSARASLNQVSLLEPGLGGGYRLPPLLH